MEGKDRSQESVLVHESLQPAGCDIGTSLDAVCFISKALQGRPDGGVDVSDLLQWRPLLCCCLDLLVHLEEGSTQLVNTYHILCVQELERY